MLAEQFPALFDYYAGSARANDSFVGGVAGAGYVFLNQLDDAQLARYTKRVGRLIKQYGPNVVDTYGYVTREIFPQYVAGAAAGGVAPAMLTSQDQRPTPPIDTFYPKPRNFWLQDGTPVVSSNTSLFYFDEDDGGLDPACPSCDFADRIRRVAAQGEQFVLTYGGLGGAADPFFALLQNATARLESGGEFLVVGAQEMARLAREAKMPENGQEDGTAGATTDCSASDAKLLDLFHTICKSLGASLGNTACPAGNVTAAGDWPNQVWYMGHLLQQLVEPETANACLTTPTATAVVKWLNTTDTSANDWWYTWLVFQPNYYDMPQRPHCRIESPATLGRKCPS